MELRRWRPVVRSRGVARIQPAGHICRDADARRPLRSNPVEVPVDHGVAGSQPTAAFVFSPTNPRVGQSVNFNASASRAGERLPWDFGEVAAVPPSRVARRTGVGDDTVTLLETAGVRPAGSSIASYTWDFGDGSPRVTTGSPVVSKTYGNTATIHGDTPRDRQLRPDGDDQRHVADSAVAWQ